MNIMAKKLELLAPAGDLEKLKYALAYGADAVYLGLPEFSLRAKTGFDFETLREGIAYARKLKKKVYVTVNIFAHEEQISILPQFLKKLKECKPDAVILSDVGVLALVKKHLPKVPIHLSTQANTLNSEAVKFFAKNGVSRIILGREASLVDIKKIHQAVPKMELEVFVHGAMCMSYSGRCYLSSWLNGRSANLGSCTQPCRWEYRAYLEEPLRPGQFMPIEQDDKGTYIMNSKDLCLIDYLSDLANAGVVSLKIEGRTKSSYYISTVSRAYRLVLDNLKAKKVLTEAKKELVKIDSRGYTTGFLLGTEKGKQQNFETSKAKSDWQFVGQVVAVHSARAVKSNLVAFKPHNVLRTGEVVELLTPSGCYKIKLRVFYDEAGEKLKEVHGGTDKTYFFELNQKVKDLEWGVLRKKVNSK
jgi:putative protease